MGDQLESEIEEQPESEIEVEEEPESVSSLGNDTQNIGEAWTQTINQLREMQTEQFRLLREEIASLKPKPPERKLEEKQEPSPPAKPGRKRKVF